MQDSFLAGVVEGFYGQPWTEAQRFQLFDQLADWGLNTYFYAPKDDLKHRALWREPYDATELDALATLIAACGQRRLNFIYGLSPGLDLRFSDPTDRERIKRRLTQLIDVGGQHFALLFDDLPGEMSVADRGAFDSVAAAQSAVSNEIFAWLRDQFPAARMFFCPTPYCDRMDRAQLGGANYLDIVGRHLASEVEVLWTGPEIISEEISVASIRRLSERICRQPVLWDNLHANDYDLRRLYCGPYAGRSGELTQVVRGILSNPNNEFPLNYVPLRTLAQYLNQPDAYEPRAAFLSAIGEWANHFETVSSPIELDDLILLADCYYLPFQEGPEAERMLRLIGMLLDRPVDAWGDAHVEFNAARDRVLRIFSRLTELKRRELFHAWSRRVWELREELELIRDVLARKQAGEDEAAGMRSETHLPKTYRGGLVARLQRKLSMDEQGRFRPARCTSVTTP